MVEIYSPWQTSYFRGTMMVHRSSRLQEWHRASRWSFCWRRLPHSWRISWRGWGRQVRSPTCRNPCEIFFWRPWAWLSFECKKSTGVKLEVWEHISHQYIWISIVSRYVLYKWYIIEFHNSKYVNFNNSYCIRKWINWRPRKELTRSEKHLSARGK